MGLCERKWNIPTDIRQMDKKTGTAEGFSRYVQIALVRRQLSDTHFSPPLST